MSNLICRNKSTTQIIGSMTMMLHRAVNWRSHVNGSILQSPLKYSFKGHSAVASALAPLQHRNHATRTFILVSSPATIVHHLYHHQQQQSPPTFSTLSSQMSIRSYSSSHTASFAIGRRRRQQISGGLGGADDELTTKTDTIDTNNKSVSVKIEPKVFLSHVTALFETVHQSMIPLIPINDGMILTRGESSRMMHEEQERKEQEERKRAKKEMKENKKTETQTSGTTNENRKQNNANNNDNDDERESASVQSIGDHRVIDGPYLKIELGPIHGQYTFVADLEFNTILFQSPISGQLIYFYDFQHTNEWINVHDQHNLLGMFVRDIIRQIQGVPKI